MNILPKDPHGCPYLFLAPMEGVGDRSFRRAMAFVGGFDEAVTEFLRVPSNAHIESLARVYQADETHPIPLAAQIMGSDPELLALMAIELEKRGAPRIDLNCGCPSNTVTGRAAGSSLLKSPELVQKIATVLVNAVSVPVTLKMRSGFLDTTLFRENILAAEESGVTLSRSIRGLKLRVMGRCTLGAHCRSKALLKIPVVGNGDILTVEDAVRMLKETSCDALMIGRGSIINPFIFHQIRSYFAKRSHKASFLELQSYLEVYMAELAKTCSEKVRVSKMKQLMGFLFKSHSSLLEQRTVILRSTLSDVGAFVDFALTLLKETWAA
jgi:tRNA-dihydrouridine synthase